MDFLLRVVLPSDISRYSGLHLTKRKKNPDLTVFTFTPSWGVCLVVRLYPSIFWASSPTTAGLGETVAQVKREQQHSSFRKRSPCEFKKKKKLKRRLSD